MFSGLICRKRKTFLAMQMHQILFLKHYWLEIQNINAHSNLTYQNMKLIKTDFNLTKIPNNFNNPII